MPLPERSLPNGQTDSDEFDWWLRQQVYEFFVEQTRPPAVDELAQQLGLTVEEVRAAYKRLHERHAFYLEPGTYDIRIANPLSAVPTQFKVWVGDKTYWANCAWDMLGIPAMLKQDAVIEASCADCGESLQLEVKGGQVVGAEAVAHFPLPFDHWYDDLVFT